MDPRIRNDAFSDEEEKLLIKAYNEWGCQWSRIARLFRGRTDRQMQKLWRKVMKKLKKTSTSIHELTANEKREGERNKHSIFFLCLCIFKLTTL